MKIGYLLLVWIFISPFSAYAQSPSITIISPGPACLNAVQTIGVAINGEYKADNNFLVQVRKEENMQVLAEIPARLVGSNIEVVHSDSSFTLLPHMRIRVVTTSPRTESDWRNVILGSKGSVDMALAAPDTVNAGEELLLKFTTFSSSSTQVTLNDSSVFTVSNLPGAYVTSYHRKGVNVTSPFYIAHARNGCGAMKVSGQVKATINSTAIKVLSVSPTAACEGSEIEVSFGTSGPELPATTRYRLRFAVFSGDLVSPRTVEIPAQLKNNVLVANFPTGFNLNRRSEYKLRIVTDSPGLLGTDTGFDYIVYPGGNVTIDMPSKSIEMGENLPFSVSFAGIAPYSATLQDGTIISSSQGQGLVNLRPEKTTAYSIASFTSGCGSRTVTGGRTMVATVKPGIALDPSSGERVFCAGSQAKVRMLSNVDFNAGTTFSVKAIINNQTAYSFSAKRNGEFLEFHIPILSGNVDYALSYDKISGFFIAADNPGYQSKISSEFRIRSKPDMVVLSHSTLKYTVPSVVNFGYELRGNGPYKIEDAAGKVYNIDGFSAWYPSLYVNKSFDFKLKSISNACFTNENLPTVQVAFDTTKAAPGIFMQPLEKTICRQDSIEIAFIKTGTFNPDNVFKIEGYIDCCTFQTLATVSGDGTYKVKIPVSQGQVAYPNFRISSTSPALSTYKSEIFLERPPAGFEIRPAGTRDAPAEFQQGQEVGLTLSSRSGAISSFFYTDGMTEKTQELTPSVWQAVVKPPVGIVNAYTIKSALNVCGSFPVDLTTYLRVVPYQITILNGEGAKDIQTCQNGNIVVPFVVQNGDASNAMFSLQIAPEKSSDFVDIAKGVTSRIFNATMPAHIATGRYRMRVVSSEGSVSNSVFMVIGAKPSATISSSEQGPIFVNPGQGTFADINFTGTAPWTVIYENSEKQTTDHNPYKRSMSATESKDFSLISVYNSCGYGQVSGKVSKKVNPALHASATTDNICAGTNVRVWYSLQGDASLENDYIVFLLVDKQTGQSTPLDSTRIRVGAVILKIPATLTGGSYEVHCMVKSYNLSAIAPVYIVTKADVSIHGNTIINAGEDTQLQLISHMRTNEAINYRLSDGSVGTFYGGSGNSEHFVRVSPRQTTTYSITSVDNGCGEGKKTGSATVEVNPAGERTVSVTKWEPSEGSAFCVGDAILVYYISKGSFSAKNVMTVQFSDTTGRNFNSVITNGTASPLTATIPNDFFIGKKYRVRVIASDPGTSGGAYGYPLTVGKKASVRFASEAVVQDESGTPKLVVMLSGTGPWQFDVGSPLGTKHFYSTTAISSIHLSETPLADYYQIVRVMNQCGLGTIEKPDVVRVEVITAEPQPVGLSVHVAPNPVSEDMVVGFTDTSEKTMRLVNAAGITILSKSSSVKEEIINLGHLPSGIYVLSIVGKNFKTAHKIIKH
jgi:hypothetical protein